MRSSFRQNLFKIFAFFAVFASNAIGEQVLPRVSELPSPTERDDSGELSPLALMQQVFKEAQELSDPQRRFEGITYTSPQYAEEFSPIWLIQTPNQWGVSVSEIPYFDTNSSTSTGDFELPDCKTDGDCADKSPTGKYGHCGHLIAFDNGVNGTETKKCVGHSDAIIDHYYSRIINATRFIDITGLQPFPDIRFLSALRNGLTYLALEGRNITVRILQGLYPSFSDDVSTVDTEYVKNMTRDIVRAYPESNITVYVGSMRACFDILGGCGNTSISLIDRTSLNHAKIVAVDGEALITGGHNSRTHEYLEEAPVHDVSLWFQSSVIARSAHRFADFIWQWICADKANPLQGQIADSKKYQMGQVTEGCLATADLSPAPLPPESGTPVMVSARLGLGLFPNGAQPANQDDVARTIYFQKANHTIQISQQDLGYNIFGTNYWLDSNAAGNPMEAIASLLLRGGDVYIVLSNYDSERVTVQSKLGYGDTYSNGVKITDVADKVKTDVTTLNAKSPHPKSPEEINALLCKHLHLAPIRFDSANQWSKQYKITNHAKVWIVDGKVFYIGSHNLYPSNLQEFGVVVGDEKLAQQFVDDYYSHLWEESSRVAISGSDNPCYFSPTLDG
ncbi:phospholipase (plasmid) [Coxiella burnetii]|uniref:Phospholipase n=1 Tax=Coxiella burnetii (strain Dugway 5J108-111) TaxID=434922 RepID=A9KH43_COXBN|nr:phospholipase D-like domain-containing protein [Coxiella burnetii]ABS78558.2 phospholipase [Coxiella burnetii Dugway 5J108-111]OYK79187.1 phospholipase [Coxiella burnetii]OYK81226.1 phospholipase [Coxiella burnetii]